MTKEIDLIGYIPPFLAEYSEMSAVLKAEEPEFSLIWNAAERTLKNEFIETADEYGISRFEKLLGILPSSNESLEDRRSMVRTRWFFALPYTFRQLIEKLVILCGDNNFSVVKNFDFYEIKIFTHIEKYGGVDDLKQIITAMIPCNMIVVSKNDIECCSSGRAFTGGTVLFTETIFVTNDFRLNISASGGAFGSAGAITEII